MNPWVLFAIPLGTLIMPEVIGRRVIRKTSSCKPSLSSSTWRTSTIASTPRDHAQYGSRADPSVKQLTLVRRSVRSLLVFGPARAGRMALDLYVSDLCKLSATISRQRHRLSEKTEAVKKRRTKNHGGNLEWAMPPKEISPLKGCRSTRSRTPPRDAL